MSFLRALVVKLPGAILIKTTSIPISSFDFKTIGNDLLDDNSRRIKDVLKKMSYKNEKNEKLFYLRNSSSNLDSLYLAECMHKRIRRNQNYFSTK